MDNVPVRTCVVDIFHETRQMFRLLLIVFRQINEQFGSHYLDNDKPTVTASPVNPVDTVNDVTLTCTNATNEADLQYKWYKNGTEDGTSIASTWNIGKTRNASGSYACAVVTATHNRTSDKSDAVTVTFLCEYH